MSSLGIIDISSSPNSSLPLMEPRAPAPTRRSRRKSKALHSGVVHHDDIIELTDSEEPVRLNVRTRASSRRPKASGQQAPVPGPSRAAAVKQPPPLFLPDPEDDHAPGRSSGKTSATSSRLSPPGEPLLAGPSGPPRPDPFTPKSASQPGSNLEADDASRDSIDDYVAQVLEIVPDALPEYVRTLVQQYYPTLKREVVASVLHSLFEDPTYPKIDPKGKGKRKRDPVEDAAVLRENARVRIDYASKERKYEGGANYMAQALQRLYADFPRIPVLYIRQQFQAYNCLYAPTYLYLCEEEKKPNLPYRRKGSTRKGKGKGKAMLGELDAELEREIDWVKLKIQENVGGVETADVESVNEEDGIECGCCFSPHSFEKMIQCPEAHLFCTDCMTTYASTLLGSHDANIVCMDQSGCKLAFPESELRRFLTPKLLGLYHRVKQRREIEAAGLENLEECPFCEYKCVIENEQEKLFHCENQECLVVTCRACKKPDHLPKSCKEIENDKKLDVRHAIEEAMTNALMRNCPSCNKAFVKEMGCNKMVCPYCRTMSCYVCRKVIKGYEHFNNPPPYTGRANPVKCQLWDSVEQRHNQEVTEAAKRAVEEFKRSHPELTDEDLRVDLPPPPPAPGPTNAAAPNVAGRPALPQVPRVVIERGQAQAAHIEFEPELAFMQRIHRAQAQVRARLPAWYHVAVAANGVLPHRPENVHIPAINVAPVIPAPRPAPLPAAVPPPRAAPKRPVRASRARRRPVA